jgi:hypothetical protein
VNMPRVKSVNLILNWIMTKSRFWPIMFYHVLS